MNQIFDMISMHKTCYWMPLPKRITNLHYYESILWKLSFIWCFMYSSVTLSGASSKDHIQEPHKVSRRTVSKLKVIATQWSVWKDKDD